MVCSERIAQADVAQESRTGSIGIEMIFLAFDELDERPRMGLDQSNKFTAFSNRQVVLSALLS